MAVPSLSPYNLRSRPSARSFENSELVDFETLSLEKFDRQPELTFEDKIEQLVEAQNLLEPVKERNEEDGILVVTALSETRELLQGYRRRSVITHEDLSLVDPIGVEILSLPSRAAEHAEQLVRKVWEEAWKVTHFHSLPDWLKDNDFLHKGHRPQLNSFLACFKSIFRIHTETGNIWTHLLGCIAFIGVAAYFLTRPSVEIHWQEKAVFTAFFGGAILCLGFSFLFHTVYCHSERVGKLFSKLDYCGIALLTMGSFVPWLYYGFYCRSLQKIAYLVLICVLGVVCIVVSLWDKFSTPQFRALRAGVFISLGLSGLIPAMHFSISDGFYKAVTHASLGWLILMGVLYILGALLYALRIPERFFPGKCDIWFQSHQIFHVLVVTAAFIHYHGISEMATYRLTLGDCLTSPEQS